MWIKTGTKVHRRYLSKDAFHIDPKVPSIYWTNEVVDQSLLLVYIVFHGGKRGFSAVVWIALRTMQSGVDHQIFWVRGGGGLKKIHAKTLKYKLHAGIQGNSCNLHEVYRNIQNTKVRQYSERKKMLKGKSPPPGYVMVHLLTRCI